MKSWRGKRRQPFSLNQPSIPGLFSAGHAHSKKRPFRKPSSPCEFALTRARARLGILFICFALFFTVASGRIIFLGLNKEATPSRQIHALSHDINVASRADIVDRNGTILASSLPTMMLMADTKKVIDVKEAVTKLKKALPHLKTKKLSQKLSSKRRYQIIQRHLTPRQYYDINKMGIAGLEYIPDESRLYPAGPILAHVLGYTDIDNKGIAGLEKAKNKELQESTKPLETSIDVRLQTIMHRELAKAMKKFKAIGATGVIMDVNTGEILSLVSLPDFNPQKAGSANNNAKFNRATLGVYEMGSTFKIFNTALALDACGIRPKQRFDTTKPILIGGQRIRDYHPDKHWMNVAEIFIKSSNIGSARMAEKCGKERQKKFLAQLGLTQKLSLEIPEIGAPLVPKGNKWGDTATMTISYGHGIAVNAVQVATAGATLVNGGYKVTPTLLKKSDSLSLPFKKGKRIISAKTSAKMRGLMRMVVKYGTGKKANVPGYMVGGKTGTADKAQGKKYKENARISSFLGVFPANAPRYVVLTLLDDPKGTTKTFGFAGGGWTAAPVAGRIIGQIGPLLNLPPIEQDVLATTERQLLRPLGRNILNTINLKKKETDNYAAIESNSPR